MVQCKEKGAYDFTRQASVGQHNGVSYLSLDCWCKSGLGEECYRPFLYELSVAQAAEATRAIAEGCSEEDYPLTRWNWLESIASAAIGKGRDHGIELS
jgi:hypothetical protein